MKIIQLKIEDLRKIKAFEADFTESGLIQIRGKNRQGKSTILDAVEILFKGKKSIPADIVQHGKTQGKIVGQVGEYIIERIVGEKSKLKITNKDGLHVSSKPQAFLDSLVNELTFNPRPFLDKNSDQKLQFLMDLLNIDFSSIDKSIEKLKNERLFAGRIVKQFGEIPETEKIEKVDLIELMQEKEAATEHNNNIRIRKEKNVNLKEKVDRYNEKIKELKKMIETSEELIKENKKVLSDLGQEKDIQPILDKIAGSEEVNFKAEQYVKNEEKRIQKDAAKARYSDFTKDIETLNQEKTKILKSKKMPVDGLELSEEGIFYHGIHSDNWSTSEALKISFELCVSMKPELNAVFIDKGESYDDQGLKDLEKWAKENDIQAFITIVDSGEAGEVENAIYIEAGEVVS